MQRSDRHDQLSTDGQTRSADLSRPPSGRRRRGVVAAVAALALTMTGASTVMAPTIAGADGDSWGPSVPGEFVVALEAGADPAEVSRSAGGIAAPVRLTPTSSLYRFRLPPTVAAPDGVQRLADQGGVVAVQPNVIAEVPEFYGGRRLFWSDQDDPIVVPAAAYVRSQPALGNAGLLASDATGAGIVVAVLDTGLDLGHPAFAGAIARGGYDLVDRDAQPAEVADGVDENGNGLVDEAFGHGTHVAGIVRLVAPQARILPIRIIDSDGRTDAWKILEGVQRAAASGARVVNLSLGGLDLGEIVLGELEARAEAGTILVAAAGNENVSELRFPAAGDGVVGVTAINGETGAKATFANHGSWIDVAAPGVHVVSTFPGGRYARWGGTSSSSPVVAGALALLAAEMGPWAAVDDIVDRLTSTARAEGLSNVSSYGRVDVAAAVTRARLG